MSTKLSLRERLANLKAKKTAASKEAKVRVAAAWTTAKTLLPGAPAEVQHRLASAIVGLDAKVLKACVKQAAVNAYWTKFAEDMDAAGAPLNKFVEEPSMLEKLKAEVGRELRGEAKNASEKQADGEIPEIEIPKENTDEAPKIGSEQKTAEYEDPSEKQAELDAEEKVSLIEKTNVAEQAVQQLEHEILDEGNSELPLEGFFGETDEKVDSLANEGDFDMDLDMGEEGLDVMEGEEGHGPSETKSLEGSLDGMDEIEVSDAADFFSQQAGEEDDFGDLFVTAAPDAEVDPGEGADFFENDQVDHSVTDAEEDHADDLIYDVMNDIKPETYSSKRDTEPNLETPKAASKKNPARPIRSLGHVASASAEQDMLARLVFPDDEIM